MKLYFIMGIPGSGKSTIVNKLYPKYNLEYVMIDTFYKNISRVDKSVEWFNDKKYGKRVYDAFTHKILDELERGNVIIEATGTGDRIQSVLSEVSKAGHEIVKIFLNIDFEKAIYRVESRNKTNYPIKVSLDDMNFYNEAIKQIDLKGCFNVDANRGVKEVVKDIEILIQ